MKLKSKTDITNLATNTTLNAKRNTFKGKLPSITNLDTTTVYNTKINDEVKCKIPSIANLATITALVVV